MLLSEEFLYTRIASSTLSSLRLCTLDDIDVCFAETAMHTVSHGPYPMLRMRYIAFHNRIIAAGGCGLY